MSAELRQRCDAAAVFALCESCAALVIVLIDPLLLIKLPVLAFSCSVGAIVAACLAPVLSRLSVSGQRHAGLKLVALGSCVGVLTLAAFAAAEAWRRGDARFQWFAHAFEGLRVPWHVSVRLWLDWVLPQGAWLFVIAGAFAARLFGRVACTPQTA